MSNYNIQVPWAGKDALADSDPNKVISGDDFNTEFSSVATAINSKADKNGDAVEAFATSTAGSGSNTTVSASTEFVTSAVAPKAPLASPTFTGTITIGSASISETELEILDGATLSTTELNKLDGVTASTTELNHTDGVTSNIQTQLNTINSTYDTKANVLLASWPVNSVYTSISSTNPSSLFGGTWVAFGAGRVLVGLDSGDSDFNTSEETGGSKTDSHTLTTSEMPSHTHGVTHTTTSPKVTGSFDGTATHSDLTGSASTETTTSTGGGSAHAHDIVQPYIVVHFFKRTA